MKHLLKNAATAFTIAITTSLSCITASAADSNTYYDVKKAGDYVLAFCDADTSNPSEYKMPSGRISRKNPDYFFRDGEDCTNFASQALYYGGYKMQGTPDIPYIKNGVAAIINHIKDIGYANCGSRNADDWFYYSYKDGTNVRRDLWSSTWTRVGYTETHGNGLYQFFTRPHEMNEPICTGISEIKYTNDEDFKKITNLKRGDIVQYKEAGHNDYGHSMFVWCT